VCSDQLVLYQEIMPMFAKHDAQVVGISVDGVWCHAAFAKHRNLHFRNYGVYRKTDGFSERALFLIDPRGKVFWSYVSPVGVNPGADGVLRALQGLSSTAAAG
jgi:peroxiredoxin